MDTDLGIHLSWTYASLSSTWLDTCFKIKTATGKIEETKIKISDSSASFPFFIALYIRNSYIDKNSYTEIPLSKIAGETKLDSSCLVITLPGTIIFETFKASSGYRINDQDFFDFIDLGTSFLSEEQYKILLGENYKTEEYHTVAPVWSNKYAFENQKEEIPSNLFKISSTDVSRCLIKKDSLCSSPNSIIKDSDRVISSWSGILFQNAKDHIGESYRIYKNSDGYCYIERITIENKSLVIKETKKYSIKTTNIILDLQAPGGKGGNGHTGSAIRSRAGGGGGGGFCRVIIDLEGTDINNYYNIFISGCSSNNDAKTPPESFLSFVQWNTAEGKEDLIDPRTRLKIYAGYNGSSLTSMKDDVKYGTASGGWVTIYQLKKNGKYAYQAINGKKTEFDCFYPYNDKIIILSHVEGKGGNQISFNDTDYICNGINQKFYFKNKDAKRGYGGSNGKNAKYLGAQYYGGAGGGASVLGYGQKGRSLDDKDYDTDWFAYGGGGGGGHTYYTSKSDGTFGQPGCFIVYGLGDEITS